MTLSTMTPTYQREPDLSVEAFIDLLARSTLAERRPVEDLARIETMLRNADLIVTARVEGRLVGEQGRSRISLFAAISPTLPSMKRISVRASARNCCDS